MSDRRFCAVEDELWDKVPSRAPNSLCPRLRSSIAPLFRSGRSCAVVGAWVIASGLSWLSSTESRGLLDSASEYVDCLRFNETGGDCGCSSASGKMTAEATALYHRISVGMTAAHMLLTKVVLPYFLVMYSRFPSIEELKSPM